LLTPALSLEKLDESSSILLVTVSLRDHLAYEDRIGPKGPRVGKELFVLDLRAQVVDLEAVVTL
jgi:hypothetical protein